MQDQSTRVSVAISFGEGGTTYGCGHSIDTMLYACELSTEEDMFEWVADREWETIRQVLKDYDWEAYTLERLNLLPTVSEEYLHGDYLRFEHPERFTQYVKEDRERVSELVRDSNDNWEAPNVPADLVKELEHARDYIADETQREWLEGDRNNPGALKSLVRAILGRHSEAEALWDTKTDTVHIEASEEEWRKWMGYDMDERDPLTPKLVSANLKAWILQKAKKVKEARSKKTLGRVAEYKLREERQQAELEKQKEEARARKAKKNQAS